MWLKDLRTMVNGTLGGSIMTSTEQRTLACGSKRMDSTRGLALNIEGDPTGSLFLRAARPLARRAVFANCKQFVNFFIANVHKKFTN